MEPMLPNTQAPPSTPTTPPAKLPPSVGLPGVSMPPPAVPGVTNPNNTTSIVRKTNDIGNAPSGNKDYGAGVSWPNTTP